MMAKTYDPACFALAEHFLQDEPISSREAAAHELALLIQQTVEDWIEYEHTDAGRRSDEYVAIYGSR